MKNIAFIPLKGDLVITNPVPNDLYMNSRSHLYGVAGRITANTFRCYQVHGWWWTRQDITEAPQQDIRHKCACGKPVDTVESNLFTGVPFDYLLCDDCYNTSAAEIAA